MDLHCPDCDFHTKTSSLKSFAGKFCPVCGQRLVSALADETIEAKKSLRTVEKVLATLYEMVDEPFHVRWGLKITILTIFLIVLQGISYAGYQVVQPLFLASNIEQMDPVIAGLFDEAHAAEAAQRLADAEALYTRILSIEPDNTQALNSIGFIARLQDDEVMAGDMYHRVLTIDFSNAVAHQNLGVIARERGDADIALTHFEQVLAVDESNTTVMYFTAHILFEKRKDLDRVEMILKNIISQLPTHKEAHLLLIDLYRLQGSTKRAAALAAAKVQFPQDAKIQSLAK